MPSKRKAVSQPEHPSKRITRSSTFDRSTLDPLKEKPASANSDITANDSSTEIGLAGCRLTNAEPSQPASGLALPNRLPTHLHAYFEAQKVSSLKSIRHMARNIPEERDLGTKETACNTVSELVDGTVTRGEGNSCILLGARGSGKTQLVEKCISSQAKRLLVLRLSGWIQTSDRLAMREIAYQVSQQRVSLPAILHDGNELLSAEESVLNDGLSREEPNSNTDDASLPPVSHLPSLISLLPRLGLPVVVLLDSFDLFALHPRQSLLYCLLDTVQSCKAGDHMHGIIVIGTTSRIDTVQLLEKRVKSRFSGRIISTSASEHLSRWKDIVHTTLIEPVKDRNTHHDEEWASLWRAAIDRFLSNTEVLKRMGELLSISKDLRLLGKLLSSVMTQLSPQSPFPTIPQFMSAAETQRARLRFPHSSLFTYPSLCLLAASFYLDTAGQTTFTFEILHEAIHERIRRSSSAPIRVNGGSIGMVRSTRSVLEKAFEALVVMKIFAAIITSHNISPEFIKYRCCLDREEVKYIIGKSGQIHLKKWVSKGQ